MASADNIMSAFTTLLVTLDPPGLAPIFLGLTAGLTAIQDDRSPFAARSLHFGILATFAVFGAGILSILGISMGAFRIAGAFCFSGSHLR